MKWLRARRQKKRVYWNYWDHDKTAAIGFSYTNDRWLFAGYSGSTPYRETKWFDTEQEALDYAKENKYNMVIVFDQTELDNMVAQGTDEEIIQLLEEAK